MTRDIFDMERLPPELDGDIRMMNPWWEGKPGPVIPEYKRWAFPVALRKMDKRLAPITVLRGPRQVGKTTLQQQIIEHLQKKQNVEPNRIMRVQFDEITSLKGMREPILSIARWYENRILKKSFNESARENRPAFLLLDEVQNVPDWAPQLKALVDANTIRVFVTGSSALRIEAGRDSLAGRIAQIDLGTLLLREIAGLRFKEELSSFLEYNGLEILKDKGYWINLKEYFLKNKEIALRAFTAFSERGGYPMVQARHDLEWPEVADQLNETVIQRAIQHDLRLGEKGLKRDPQLLEEVFRIACRYSGQAPGQAVFVPEIKNALGANIGWQRILTYLKFLDGTMLLKMIQPLEIRLKRKKGNAKICICDHALRASWLQEIVPIDEAGLGRSPHLTDLAGHLVESITGYYLTGLQHLDVAHFPERGAEPEVDFILTIGEQRIPLEIKYQSRIDPNKDTLGLRAFIEKSVYNAPFGILVVRHEGFHVDDPRIVCLPLPALLLLR